MFRDRSSLERSMVIASIVMGLAAFHAAASRTQNAQDNIVPQSDRKAAQETGLARSPWPKFHGNPQNTGVATSKTADQVRPWVFEMLAHIGWSSPAIGQDGTVYVEGDTIYALDGNTGHRKWEFNAGQLLASQAALDGQGLLYSNYDTTSDVHRFYAIDTATGKARWACSMHSKSYGCPAIGANGLVYVQSEDGVLYALDSTSGRQCWTFTPPGPSSYPHTSPSIGADGAVYTTSGNVYALDCQTGKLKWKYELAGYQFQSSVAVGLDGTVYAGALNYTSGKVVALDGATGHLKWEFQAGLYIQSSPAIDTDGTVYIGCGDGNLYALDGKTGALRWKFKTGDGILCCPAIGPDHTVYFGSYDHKMYAVDGRTGVEKWETDLGARIPSSSALGTNGLLYVVTWDGVVYALRASDGAKGNIPLFPDQ